MCLFFSLAFIYLITSELLSHDMFFFHFRLFCVPIFTRFSLLFHHSICIQYKQKTKFLVCTIYSAQSHPRRKEVHSLCTNIYSSTDNDMGCAHPHTCMLCYCSDTSTTHIRSLYKRPENRNHFSPLWTLVKWEIVAFKLVYYFRNADIDWNTFLNTIRNYRPFHIFTKHIFIFKYPHSNYLGFLRRISHEKLLPTCNIPTTLERRIKNFAVFIFLSGSVTEPKQKIILLQSLLVADWKSNPRNTAPSRAQQFRISSRSRLVAPRKLLCSRIDEALLCSPTITLLCLWFLRCDVCACVCVCVWERDRVVHLNLSLGVCVAPRLPNIKCDYMMLWVR